MSPTREVYWNIGDASLLYVLLVPTLLIFAYGLYRRIRLWRIGAPTDRSGDVIERLKALAIFGVGHGRIAQNRFSGLFHVLVLSGFTILFIGTLAVWVHVDFGLRIMQGNFYLYFQSLTLDVFGLFATVGLLLAACRRMLFKPERLDNTGRDWVLLLLLVILLTGFMLEGLRIAATNDPWGRWSPVGFQVARLFTAVLSADGQRSLHAALWWGHLVLVFGLIAYLPYSKLLHILTGATNIYLRSLGPKGAILKPIDLETAETFGASKIEQLSWKDLLDLDACTECGRCQDACPAFATNKPLSPKSLILDMRRHLHAHSPRSTPGGSPSPDDGPLLAGGIIDEETLWSCTNCRACMEVCPVFIEHVPKIIDMRRYLVMEEGRAPETMQQAMRSLEANGHPFPGITASRLDWCRGLDVKILAEGESAEYLYWVGCATALNARNHNTARAFSEILLAAGVDFAILGNEEHCTGDAARRMGNEYLFQSLAHRVIDLLKSRKVKKIVTACPHCFNTFKNDFPQLGAEFEVYHHSQFLARLVAEGKWKTPGGLPEAITYHDPCHLGRYNETYDEPRAVIGAVPGADLVEMERHRQTSFCCGAGGGRMWADEPSEQRVSNVRAREALDSGAQTLAVACPFCMAMLDEGVNLEKGERNLKVLDIAELLRGDSGS